VFDDCEDREDYQDSEDNVDYTGGLSSGRQGCGGGRREGVVEKDKQAKEDPRDHRFQ
jgi:hypothetical protein